MRRRRRRVSLCATLFVCSHLLGQSSHCLDCGISGSWLARGLELVSEIASTLYFELQVGGIISSRSTPPTPASLPAAHCRTQLRGRRAAADERPPSASVGPGRATALGTPFLAASARLLPERGALFSCFLGFSV